jgi:PAS domain S-box-containing protein
VSRTLGDEHERLADEVAELERRARGGDTDGTASAEALDELQASLEELRVLEEELQTQSSELAATREELESENGRYRSLFELAPDAYLVTDPLGKIVEANRAAQDLFGVSHHYLLGKVVASFVPLQERPAFRRQLLKIADTRGVLETETRFRTRGRTLDASISIAPMRTAGALEGFRWIVRDVTSRKQAEWELRTLTVELDARVAARTKELEEERARLNAIVEQIPTGLLITNGDGDVVFMNRPAEQQLAEIRSTEELRFAARFPAFRVDGEPYPEEERPVTRALRSGEFTNAEQLYFERREGSRVPFEVSAAPIRDSLGRITAAALTIQDLTDRERRERSEREFVANAAHELRTPIAAVLGAVEVLQAGAKEKPDDRDLFLGHIEREAARLARLAHALLVLARAQAGGGSIKPEVVELRALLTTVAEALDASEEVEIAVECPRDLRVWTNEELLEQAVASLARNAVANTTRGCVTLMAEATDSDVALEVRDTGRGVDAAEREKIFERFYRTTGSERDGFGIGLAIVRQAAHALGAEVDLESEVGVGTTFRLRLPAKLLA